MRPRRQPEIIAGRVNGADGAIIAGDGFTAVRSGVGLYAVTLGPGFRLVSVTAMSLAGNSVANAGNVAVGERTFTISVFVASTLANADHSFAFTAVGVQQ